MTELPKKRVLLNKLINKPAPKNFTIYELDVLMSKCGCKKFTGGRGSSVGYVHIATGRVLQFDAPHPGKNLYGYQIKKTIKFLGDIDELGKE